MTPAIEVEGATKLYQGVRVVDDVSFTAQPGRVTALLGPNGAGKSTTLRAIVGIDHLDAGTALVAGRRYADHPQPLRTVGALLETEAIHPARTACTHLRVVAASNALPRDSVEEALALAGLERVADVPVGQMSLGMRQRLGLATALIGDPQILILDEPHNGLDAGAIRWLRQLLRQFADAGRTVLLSSHLMTEVETIADDVVVIVGGRIVVDDTLAGFLGQGSAATLEDRYLAQVDAW